MGRLARTTYAVVAAVMRGPLALCVCTQHAALKYPGLTFVGMFPGIVVTELGASTFPACE